MKEVLTKSFWQGVKKTFDEAREGPPQEDKAIETPAEGEASAASTPETPPSPPDSGEVRGTR